ncbi:DUF1540 domain-containing protein [Streptomyces sp. ST2-7A]|uniref:DUF1540 domain-containing protein n=1 Tax=Streptomyces sp. ST2-7A TaxID=2907214 RepID=UPI001F1EB325|nr:DUF1540 domain-containing protein [Streptomyces sp. ST2-7A]MCE7080268.1 DUF1540 domain-containing protein [Streptomyces sp. ST2-7A]
MALQMLPLISECTAASCAFNTEHSCHAPAITVGNVQDPLCDTYLTASDKGGDPSSTGRVGACKMADCRHNDHFECHAPGISVGYQDDKVDCLTYATA